MDVTIGSHSQKLLSTWFLFWLRLELGLLSRIAFAATHANHRYKRRRSHPRPARIGQENCWYARVRLGSITSEARFSEPNSFHGTAGSHDVPRPKPDPIRIPRSRRLSSGSVPSPPHAPPSPGLASENELTPGASRHDQYRLRILAKLLTPPPTSTHWAK